jgi:hypothetical protein
MGGAGGTSGGKIVDFPAPKAEPADLPVSAAGGAEAGRVATVPVFLGVQYSQPGRYQP